MKDHWVKDAYEFPAMVMPLHRKFRKGDSFTATLVPSHFEWLCSNMRAEYEIIRLRWIAKRKAAPATGFRSVGYPQYRYAIKFSDEVDYLYYKLAFS